MKTQEGVIRLDSGYPATKVPQLGQKMSNITKKVAFSVLAMYVTTVTLVTNHFVFIK